MDLTEISNLTLYQLINNNNLSEEIKQQANVEFLRRNLSREEIKNIVLEFEKTFSNDVNTSSLSLKRKILLVLFPVAIPIQFLFFMQNHNKNDWRKFWNLIGLGCLLWTIIIILIFRYVHHLELITK